MFVDASEVMPVIAPKLLNTKALELAAAPATAPDIKDASVEIVEPATVIDDKDPIVVIFG